MLDSARAIRGTAALAAIFSILLVACGSDDDAPAATQWVVRSPDRSVVATLAIRNLAGTADYPDAERLYYRVDVAGVQALDWSPLGLRTDRADFSDDPTLVATQRRAIRESYTTTVGKRRDREARANQIELRFDFADGPLELILHAADDGVAYRYRLPGDSADAVTVTAELSGFRLADDAAGWLIPYSNPTPFTPAYERYAQKVVAGDTNRDNGWGYTALFTLPDSDLHVLISESDLDGDYAGTHLAQPSGSLYRIAFPDAAEGRGVGATQPTARLPLTTPWRVIVIGDLPAIFASTLVDDLAAPADSELFSNVEWIAPGRSAWSWLTQDTGTPELQREYVDFAAEMGWELVLVDARWDEWPNGEADVLDLIDYADARGVGILLWYNSGGEHNVIATETPRDRMDDPTVRREELAKIASWGVRGIKVDFFQSEKQDRIQQYLGILEDAAANRLLVNFHGCTIPRGWHRTYPNLMTMESVRGAENYRLFDGPDAIDNVRYVFTRNVVGSMDYTPVTFAAALDKQQIPYAHQLALAVVFESGIQHFADNGDADPTTGYRRVFGAAPFAGDLLREVPVVWDESLLVEGGPDSHAVVARRSGAEWYLAGISGLLDPLQLSLELDFLAPGAYDAEIISTGSAPEEMTRQFRQIRGGDVLDLELGAKDGFVAVLRRAN